MAKIEGIQAFLFIHEQGSRNKHSQVQTRYGLFLHFLLWAWLFYFCVAAGSVQRQLLFLSSPVPFVTALQTGAACMHCFMRGWRPSQCTSTAALFDADSAFPFCPKAPTSTAQATITGSSLFLKKKEQTYQKGDSTKSSAHCPYFPLSRLSQKAIRNFIDNTCLAKCQARHKCIIEKTEIWIFVYF